MFRTLAGTLLLFALSTPAAAEVVDAQANGFALKYVYDIARPRAGGCFCERLPAGGTQLEVTYNVGGFMPGGLAPLAPLVDQVVALSLTRFTTFVETGRPE